MVEIQSPTGGCKHSCLFSIFSLILPSHPLSVSIHASQLLFPAGFRVVRNIHSLIAYITFSFPTIFYLRNEKKKRENWDLPQQHFLDFQDAKRNGKHGTSSCTSKRVCSKNTSDIFKNKTKDANNVNNSASVKLDACKFGNVAHSCCGITSNIAWISLPANNVTSLTQPNIGIIWLQHHLLPKRN